jgi:large subunit ribosomal protein L15
MDLTEARQLTSRRKRRKRVGRGTGSGTGKTCGRGHKGCGARSGGGVRRLTEGGQMPFFRRMPKVGFSNARFAKRYVVVNISDLEEYFEKGDMVNPAELRKRRLVSGSRDLKVKILGDGELSKSLTVKADKFSKSAETKITAAGGHCEVL